MGLFSRRKRDQGAVAEESVTPREAREATIAHLSDFVTTRVGVEAYVEPPNAMNPTTVLLVATDGEWTRRRVPDAPTAHEVARSLGIPSYDVQRTGYPQRYRDWNTRQKKKARREADAADRHP
jgi:hypothetical protein